MSNYDSVGIFDSGVGGITVLKEIMELLPNENLIYYADCENAPYGDRTVEEIKKFSDNIVKFLMEKKCKIIVIACNTATVSALRYLKDKYNIPIIGVVYPGAKKVVETTENGKVGILCTTLTAETGTYKETIRKISENLDVYQVPCPKLCPMIEKGWDNFEDRGDVVDSYISKLPKEIDTLLLACTHYPIIFSEFKNRFSGNIIDPSKVTSSELLRIMTYKKMLNKNSESGKKEFYVSGTKNKFKEISENYLGINLDSVNYL